MDSSHVRSIRFFLDIHKDTFISFSMKNNFKISIFYVLIYNGTTILHYLLGGVGIILGYYSSRAAYIFGFLYLVFSFLQMYMLMPLMVCPNCVYYRMKNSLCTSGLNKISWKIAKEGDLEGFNNRRNDLFCHNHLYMAALFIPILAMTPALFLNFSLFLQVP